MVQVQHIAGTTDSVKACLKAQKPLQQLSAAALGEADHTECKRADCTDPNNPPGKPVDRLILQVAGLVGLLANPGLVPDEMPNAACIVVDDGERHDGLCGKDQPWHGRLEGGDCRWHIAKQGNGANADGPCNGNEQNLSPQTPPWSCVSMMLWLLAVHGLVPAVGMPSSAKSVSRYANLLTQQEAHRSRYGAHQLAAPSTLHQWHTDGFNGIPDATLGGGAQQQQQQQQRHA